MHQYCGRPIHGPVSGSTVEIAHQILGLLNTDNSCDWRQGALNPIIALAHGLTRRKQTLMDDITATVYLTVQPAYLYTRIQTRLYPKYHNSSEHSNVIVIYYRYSSNSSEN